MKQKFFIIYDSKSQSYKPPYSSENKFTIVREIGNLLKRDDQKDNVLLTNAEDFSIFETAELDLKTGLFSPLAQLEHVANLHEIRAMIQQNQM